MKYLYVWLGFFMGVASCFLFLFLIVAIVSFSGTNLTEKGVQFSLPNDDLQVGIATDIKIKDKVAYFTFEGKKYVLSSDNVVFFEEAKS